MDAPDAGPARAHDDDAAAAEASRRWRSLWRVHFYAGVLAMPFILLMALTGLVILYTQPLQDATQRGLRSVDERTEWLSFDRQAAAVADRYPDAQLLSMTVPSDRGRSTSFAVDDGSATGRDVFVDPYTAEVLGDTKTGGGIVGLANRLHGFLNNEAVSIPLPAVSALWDGEAVMRDYVVGDLVLELFGVWTLVLIATGLFLWWPRRSRSGGTARNGRSLLSLRLRKRGRARWRDLHGLAGVVLLVVMAVTVVSGMGWSTYWGPNFGALANELTPNQEVEAPSSGLVTRGDLDRLGNQIPWNTGDRPIPSSYAPASADGTTAAPLSLDAVVRIAQQEGMKPGYTVNLPKNDVDEAGNATYGSFTVSNSWPRKTGEGRDLFLDQFTGKTLDDVKGWGYGAVSYTMDVLVSTHMGTQLGLFSRIFMTALCLLSIWSVVSALVMYTKRRRPGTLGLPRRPLDVRLARRIALVALGLGIVFPQWGVAALLLLALDRYVIRRVRPLRVAFGQTA
jgi:uncharacterized iron-regulated membrane protein